MGREKEIRSQVIGFLIPIFMEDNPETGKRLNGLGPEDFEKVVSGYACPECLAEFSHYTIICPACRYTRDVAADIREAPALWVDHLRDHYEDRTPYTKTRNPLAEGSVLDDVETVSVRKLRPSKFGRGK